MANFSTSGSINSSYRLELNVWENWIKENYSNVHWEVILRSTGNYSFNTIGSTIRVDVDGEVYNEYSQKSLNSGGAIIIASGDKDIEHDSNGSKTIYCSASYTQSSTASYTPGNMSCGGNVKLTDISRYANFTKHYIASKTINSVTIHWEADTSCNDTQYSINDGAWTRIQGSSYPKYNITDLNPNTTYKLRTRIKSTNSGLWTVSNEEVVTTYDIAKITEANDLKIGEEYMIKFSNPSKAEVEVAILTMDDKTIVPYRKVEDRKIVFSKEEILGLYKNFGNQNTYNAKLFLKSIQNKKEYYNFKEIIIKLTGNINSVTLNVNGKIKKGKVWIGTSAGNKAGVFLVGTSNGNRRGI